VFSPRRMAVVVAAAAACSLLSAGSAFAYPSSYQNSWNWDSRDGRHCTWTVYNRVFQSPVFPTHDQVKISQWMSCSEPMQSIVFSQGFGAPNPSLGTMTVVSNAVGGGTPATNKTCNNASSCTITGTWDGIPRGATVSVNQNGGLDLPGSSDIWTNAPCGAGVGYNADYCTAQTDLTAP
jgi:hypothetical protein